MGTRCRAEPVVGIGVLETEEKMASRSKGFTAMAGVGEEDRGKDKE